MGNCCNVGAENHHKKTILVRVLIINSIMFFAQFSVAILAHSSALLADSLDMLGDALTYAFSLYAAVRGERWLAKAAVFKASIIILFSLVVYIEVLHKLIFLSTLPKAKLMGLFSVIGLFTNGVCLYMLAQHRKQDINMYSTWVCARNDIIGNISVLLTAGLTLLTASRWPDVIVGTCFASILLFTGIKLLIASASELKRIRD